MNIFTKLASLFKSDDSRVDDDVKTSPSISLKVSKDLKDFLENEVLDGLDISSDHFWKSFEEILNEFSPRNKDLLEKREDIQSSIDAWHIERRGSEHNHMSISLFLKR